MWGSFIKNIAGFEQCSRWEESMGDIYRKKSLTINLSFFVLVLASFIFLNLIFVKHVNNLYEDQQANTSISTSYFTNPNLVFSDQGSSFKDLNLFSFQHLSAEKLNECKMILFALNLLFFSIVLYIIL